MDTVWTKQKKFPNEFHLPKAKIITRNYKGISKYPLSIGVKT